MFYEDENFIIGAVIGFFIGALIIWFYRNWQDSKKPTHDAEIRTMREEEITKLKEEAKEYKKTIFRQSEEIEIIKQIDPLLEQKLEYAEKLEERNKAKIKENQELDSGNSAKRIEKNQLQEDIKRIKSEINKAKNQLQDEDLNALNKKSSEIPKKPKDSPKQ